MPPLVAVKERIRPLVTADKVAEARGRAEVGARPGRAASAAALEDAAKAVGVTVAKSAPPSPRRDAARGRWPRPPWPPAPSR